MKLHGIEIEQFEAWQELSLPISSDGLTVVWGANESGKSALRRFIRGVLFGFQRDNNSDGPGSLRRRGIAGALRGHVADRAFEIRRASHDGSVGSVTSRWLTPMVKSVSRGSSLIEHCDWETNDNRGNEASLDEASLASDKPTLPLNELLQETLRGVSARLFDQVFSLGLRELHDIANLTDTDLERAVHGETLGPYGQALLAASDDAWERAERLWDEANPGSLSTLLAQLRELDEKIARQQQRMNRYRELIRLRRQHERRLAELPIERRQVQDNLRGYTHLERVWTPWQRLRTLREELLRLPHIDDFPEGGIARFDAVEQQLRAALQARETLLNEAREFHQQARKVTVPRELRRCAAEMRGLLDQRTHILRQESRAKAAHAALQAQKQKLDAAIATLGPEWSQSRLEGLDVSMAAHYRLMETARQFRRAAARRRQWKLRLVRLSQTSQQLRAELAAGTKRLGGRSLEEALRAARRQRSQWIASAHSLPSAQAALSVNAGEIEAEHLRLRVLELEQRRIRISRQLERLEPRLILPKWVLGVLGFFAIGGVTLSLIGLVTGFATNALAGAAYALLGTACGGLSLSLKLHFEQQVRDSLAALNEELRENEARLREAREAWEKLTGSEPSLLSPPMLMTLATAGVCEVESPVSSPERACESATPANVLHLASEATSDETLSVEELERLSAAERELQRQQTQRSRFRARFDAAARELTAARQAWCATLRERGLPESVRISETFDFWQRLTTAKELLKTLQASEAEFQRQLEEVQGTRARIVALLSRLDRRDLEQKPTAEIFQAWDQDLSQLAHTLRERIRLRREERRRRAEVAEASEKIADLRLQRSALLRQACATDREDFARRAIIVERHVELQRRIDETKIELEAANRANPELAIAEEDLLQFDASNHAQQLMSLRQASENIDRELEQRHHELGRIRQEILQLEEDEEPSEWLLDREILRSKIQSAAEEWLACEWSRLTFEGIQARYERVCQPGVLAAASRFLSRLTSGKFRTLWTPLRQRALQVDDALGTTWRLEQLSGSTRELLLLAIRLAVIEDFHRKGVTLPLLLDDVLLTLDPPRAAVAANELVEFANRGHQVLFFTCHPHLVSLFANAGCPTLKLSQYLSAAERKAG